MLFPTLIFHFTFLKINRSYIVFYKFLKFLLELRTAFDLLDTNQDGKITPEELQLMLDKLGISVKAEAAHDLIKCASHAGDELIDENEFLHWVKRIQSLRPEEQVDDETAKNVMAAFKVFDLDNDGFITRDELRQAMSTIGETATEEQLSEFIELADMDKDGKINYEGMQMSF